jgi:hypothetical protein
LPYQFAGSLGKLITRSVALTYFEIFKN